MRRQPVAELGIRPTGAMIRPRPPGAAAHFIQIVRVAIRHRDDQAPVGLEHGEQVRQGAVGIVLGEMFEDFTGVDRIERDLRARCWPRLPASHNTCRIGSVQAISVTGRTSQPDASTSQTFAMRSRDRPVI
jgi:hypothetical protein